MGRRNMCIAIVAQCSCELLIHIPYVIRGTFHAPWTNSGETWAISTNSIISHLWKAFDLGNSLLESSHDLYRSPLHLEQLIRSSCLRRELFAWGNSGILSERNGRWLDAREGEEGWYQSISSLSEWQGWVPFNFLVVRYLNKWLCHCWHHQNTSSDTSGNLPLHCVPFIMFSLHQGSLILLQGYCQCVYVCGVIVSMHACVWLLLCFLNDKFHNRDRAWMLLSSLLKVST